MTKLKVVIAALAAFLLLGACGGDSGSIEVDEARYRMAREDLGAGYLTITNNTDEAVTLMGASTEGFARVELHETVASDDGVMAMEARPDGFVVGAGETISLEPGGKHLMFFEPSAAGDDLTINLDFGDQTLEVVASFDAAASASMDDAMDHSDMGDSEMDDSEMTDMDDADTDMEDIE